MYANSDFHLESENPDYATVHGLFILVEALINPHDLLNSFEAKDLHIGRKNMPRQSLTSWPQLPPSSFWQKKAFLGKFKYECVGC